MKKALILAGGFGTRLREVVKDVPKPMVLFVGKPFLEHQMRYLKTQGIEEVILAVHYWADKIKSYFRDGRRINMNITYSDEDTPLGTAGALKKAENLLDENFVLVNGDTYHDIDYKNILNFHKKNKAFITIASHRANENNKNFHRFLEEEGKVKEYYGRKEHSYSNAAATGIFVINKEILKKIEEGVAVSLEYELIDYYARRGKVFTIVSDSYYRDIGTPKDCEEFGEDIKNKIVHV